MKTRRSITALVMSLLCCLYTWGQDIVVTVNPTQELLPPQVLLYLTDPGKYFNITLTNSTTQPQEVYLGLQLEQTNPSSGLAISTPPHRQPQRPFVVPAGSSYQLTTLEMKKLFDHIPASEVSCPPDLFTNYSNGSFGLLPEGLYQIHITAYRWRETVITTPEVVSNPVGGIALFRVCYKAQAPDFILPSLLGTADPSVAEIDPLNAMFTWSMPVIACGSNFSSYTYDLRIVELLNGQQPDYAMDHNPIVYQAKDLMAPVCMIPTNIIKSKFYPNQKYVAQITAKGNSANRMDYVLIENGGKSSLRLFRIKTDDEPEPTPPAPAPTPEDDDEEEEEEEDDDISVLWGKETVQDSVNTDSMYTFRNPTFTSPDFLDYAARKIFTDQPLVTTWRNVFHVGGEGLRPDTLRFSYELQLFNNGPEADREAALAGAPIYTKQFTDEEEFKDSIPWDFLKDHVSSGDYLVMRVKPICVNGHSVAFTNDSVNVLDFAIIEPLSKQYFECSNQVEIDNTTPTELSAEDLRGKVVAIGEYELTIDEIKEGSETDTWEGKGRVEWNPLGTTIMVCVKFSDLKINTDNQVFAGTAKTYAAPGTTDADVVENLFSDWGIDNLISDTNIPYASSITSSMSDKAKDLAKKVDLSKYYSYVKKGQQIWNLLGKTNLDELYFPVGLPKEVNSSPVDLQIAGMKFAATHATMDIIGQFTLPKSNYLKNDILVLGAPRLCISPDNIIPEGGTVALLSNFGIKDPESTYEMTFKAPSDLLKPTDGCYIAWKDYKFEIFGIDVEMKIPGLKKDVNGVAINETPTLKFQASISEWEDWMIDNVDIDPFQIEDYPGWTFTASNIVYDHSIYRNSAFMGSFPANYDKSKVLKDGQIHTWEGLYIKKIAVKMPKSLEFGTSGDRRLEIAADNMFFDKSGATLEIGANDILSAKTGKAGGWAFSLDKVNAKFIQNDFTHCGFSGKFEVPLLEGQIGYSCQILKVNNLKNAAAGNYAYVFKVQQVDNLSLDFFLATATFDKNLSYILVEAVPEQQKLVTRVEMLMSGNLDIGGAAMKKKMADLPFQLDLPDIHFSKMRLANCKTWESQFDDIKAMQTQKDATKIKLKLYEGKEFNIQNKFFFHTGAWSLASMEKDLGPFKFSLEDFKFEYKNEIISLGIEGGLKLIEGIDLSASAGVTIKAKLTGLSGVSNFDFSKLSLTYQKTEFNKASFNTSFAGMTLKGSLTAVKDDKDKGNGYSGTLEFVMPGNLFTARAYGGYYERPDFTWGYFYASVGGATGIPIPPVTLNNISAGFYFNCVRKNVSDATPKKGIIGVVAGLGIASSAGKDVFGGDFEMTVIYDKDYVNPKTKKKGRLSTFMFTGDMQAVGGIIKSKASLVYEETDLDKYLALNITVDGKVDNGWGDMANKLDTKLSSLQKQLNSKFQSTLNNVTGGLSHAFNDNSPSSASKAKGPSVEKPTVGKFTASLDLRITMKENGKTLNKVKWHLYLGEPEESKRCQFILLDFKSPIVSVNVGANAYLCIGNELPGNGELPDIPTTIRDFLNGSTAEGGVQSADLSKAENAREAALREFKAQVNGGVMMGASAWGSIDVDLGLFYAYLGAIAGFDVSLLNVGNSQCMNIGTRPGYNGWYAEGQLYAYLKAVLGVRIDLGFWKQEFDFLNSELGGVMRMGLPNPTYLMGDFRMKLRLLGGLVNIDRKFEFECGQGCDLFYGNALDKFKLFADCSLGDEIKEKGWNTKNKINPSLYVMPTVNTEAPLNEHFRVLDETELNRMAANFNGDKEMLKSQASRTFIFEPNPNVMLFEYDNNEKLITTRYFKYKGKGRFKHTIDMLELTPNRKYRMVVTGYAYEIQNGQKVNPLKWNESKKKYESEMWYQQKSFYFCTGDREGIKDTPEDFQKYVAIAYPSHYNELQPKEKFGAYVADIEYPNIAFMSNISNKVFQKGNLYWCLLEDANGEWDKVKEEKAEWVVSDSTCNLTIANKGFAGLVYNNQAYRLKLEHRRSTTKTKWVNGKQKPYIETTTTVLADMTLRARDGFYHTGVSGQALQYEKPFVGISLNRVSFNGSSPRYSGHDLGYYNKYTANGKVARYADPYTYISYMSQYALVGGYRLTADKMGINATTSESLIYQDKGGVMGGNYRETLADMQNGYHEARNKSQYLTPSWEYPLPVMDDGRYNYALGGTDRAYTFTPAGDRAQRALKLVEELYHVHLAVDKFDNAFRKHLQSLVKTAGVDYSSDALDKVKRTMQNYTGIYVSASYGNAMIKVPYYQLAILWGSQFANSYPRSAITMWGCFKDMTKSQERPHERQSEEILLGLVGNTPTELLTVECGGVVTGVNNKGKEIKSKKQPYIDFSIRWDHIKEVNVTYYRVNAYNHKKAEYTVNTNSKLNRGPCAARYNFTFQKPYNYLKKSFKTNINTAFYNK